MRNRWHKFSVTIYGRYGKQEPGTVSAFLEGDLRSWFLGWSIDVDECWFDFKLSLGPVWINFMYWRHYTELIG